MSTNQRKNTNRGGDEPAARRAKRQPGGKSPAAKPKSPPADTKVKSHINHKSKIHPKSEIHPTSEIEHPTSEIEHPKLSLERSEKSEIHSKSEIQTLPTAHSKLQTDPMEVHHHPQLEHNPKPIKEYLLEGFMIFIAVMMGFIAENVRETIDNNEQVKHLTSQLVQDLRADTAQLNHVTTEEIKILKYNDTLISLAQQPLAKADTRRIQKMVANSHSMWIFHPSAGAVDAIKNQVHLSQFSNSGIIRYFAQYEKHIDLLRTDREINLEYQRAYLDPFLTQHLTPANMVASFDDAARPGTQMRNLTQADMDQLAADMVLIRLITREMVQSNQLVKADAVALLQYVKKEYRPDE